MVKAPAVWPGLEFYYGAMCDLGTERQFGFGMGPIPWSKIMMYGDRAGIMGAALDDFTLVIRMVDSEFLKQYAVLKEKLAKTKPPPKTGGRNRIGGG